MGITQRLGTIPLAISTDTSNNVGIGGSPSGSYKLEVTGTAKVSSTLLVGSTVTAIGLSKFWDGTQGFNIGAATFGTGYGALYSTGVTPSSTNFSFTSNGLSSYVNATNDAGITINNGSKGIFLVSSGNVGIGTSSPANLLHLAGTSATPSLRLSSSANIAFYWDIGRENASTGDFVFNNAVGGAATERMRITSGGNVGIGTSSPTNKLQIGTMTVPYSGNEFAIGNGTVDYAIDVSATSVDMYSSAAMSFATSTTERMRITSGGRVLINTGNETARLNMTFGGGGQNGFSMLDGDNTVNATFIDFKNSSGTIIGYIGRAGGTNAVVYSTTSDYRLKEDLKDFNGLEKVTAIKVYDFNWIGTNERTNGVIAHELAEVLPFAVTGEKDKIDEEGNIVYQGVDYSKIVPVLVKAIQELNQQNQDLKSRLDKAGL